MRSAKSVHRCLIENFSERFIKWRVNVETLKEDSKKTYENITSMKLYPLKQSKNEIFDRFCAFVLYVGVRLHQCAVGADC